MINKNSKFVLYDLRNIDKKFYNWYTKCENEELTVDVINYDNKTLTPKEYNIEIPFDNIMIKTKNNTNINADVYSNGKVRLFRCN